MGESGAAGHLVGDQGSGSPGHSLSRPEGALLAAALLSELGCSMGLSEEQPSALGSLPPRPPALLRSAGRGKRPWPPELAPSPEKGKTQGLACASLAERPPSASTPSIFPKRGQLAWLVAGGWGDSTGKGWGQRLTPDLWHALWYGSHLSLRLGCHIPQGPQTSPTSGWTLVKAKEQGPSSSPQF